MKINRMRNLHDTIIQAPLCQRYIFWIQTTCPIKLSNLYLTLLCFAFLISILPQHITGPSFSFFCACFYALLLANCFRIKSSTHLIQFPWQYGFATLQIITLVPLTPFATCWLATPFFQVSHDLLSSNDTGHHTVQILITLDSWFSIPGRCNLISVCCDQNPHGFY